MWCRCLPVGGKGAFQPYAGIGAGTYNTHQANGGFSGANGSWDYALGANKEKSKGFYVWKGANPDSDGYDSHSETARLSLKINKDHKLEVTLLQSRMNEQYDGYGYPGTVQDDHSIRTIQIMGLNWSAQWTPDYKSRLLLTRSNYDYMTQPGLQYATNTVLRNYVFQNDYCLRHTPLSDNPGAP